MAKKIYKESVLTALPDTSDMKYLPGYKVKVKSGDRFKSYILDSARNWIFDQGITDDQNSRIERLNDTQVSKLEGLNNQSQLDGKINTATANAVSSLIPITSLVLPRGSSIPSYITTKGKATLKGNDKTITTYTNTGTTPATIVVDIGNERDAFYDKVTDTWTEGLEQKLPIQDLTDVNNSITSLSNDIKNSKDYLKYSATTTSNANATALSAINNVEILVNGKLSKIKGRFPAIGNLVLFIARNKRNASSPYRFDIARTFNIAIPKTGEQTIDVGTLNINVEIGDRIGVSTASTSKPYYGSDATVGFGWYQTTSTPAQGDSLTFNEAASASWALGFEVSEFKFAEKVNVYDKPTTNELLAVKMSRNEIFKENKPYDLPFLIASSNADVYILNDKPALADGYIKTLTLNALTEGLVRLQILTRTTFNATNPLDRDSFIAGKSFTINVNSGIGTYVIEDLVNIKKGQYLAITGGEGSILTPYNATTSLSGHLGWFQSGPGLKIEGSSSSLQYQPFTAIFEYTIESDLFVRVSDEDYKINVIRPVRNVDNFNSIRDTISNITDNTSNNEYIILVDEGVWPECDWLGKKHVYIIGQSRNNTKVVFDPNALADKLAPDDYAFAAYAGVPFKDIPKIYRHLIFPKNDINIKNITLHAISSKYTMHIDNVGYSKVYCENVLIKEDDCSYAIGVGINGGQELHFEKCTVEAVTGVGKLGVFLHNWNNQTAGSKVLFNRCKFDNCGYAMIDELGSGQVDIWDFPNCFTTDKTNAGDFTFMVDRHSSGNTFYIDPITGLREPNPANVPYNIKLNTTGTKIRRLNFSDASNFNPSYTWKQRDEVKIKKYNDIDV